MRKVKGVVEEPMETIEDKALRLAVLDDEDLAVVSAHLQDADVTAADMAYLPAEKRFALVVARFDWPMAARGQHLRRSTGIHFERVLHVARNGSFGDDATRPLQLLAIAFVPDDVPSGTVLMTFAGGAQIKLSVECLEAEMRDLGPRWSVERPPGHPTEVVAPAAGRRGSPA